MGELRVKEVDRLQAVIDMVTAFGARADADGDTLSITGVGRAPAAAHLRGARFDSRGDHRMAMAAAVAALAAAPGERSLITGFGAVETSYPALRRRPRPPDRARTAGAPGPHHRHRRPGRRRQVDRLAGPWRPSSASNASIRGRCTAPSPPWPWPATSRPRTTRRSPRWPRKPTIVVGPRVVIDGLDVTGVIRSPEVGQAVSVVAANADVRAAPGRRCSGPGRRSTAAGWSRVGTSAVVVFPQAEVKVYLTASPEERARRRHDESAAGVARRDRIDSTRAASPLTQAADAHLLDTTGRTVQDVVEEVLSWL